MPDGFTDEELGEILQTARAALELPSADRAAFIRQQLSDNRIAGEAIKVTQELECPNRRTTSPEYDDRPFPAARLTSDPVLSAKCIRRAIPTCCVLVPSKS
jgi:hypothetical protein